MVARVLFLSVLIGAGAAIFGGCSGAPKTIKKSSDYDAAVQARANGQLAKAQSIAERNAGSGDIRTKLLLADILLLRGKHRAAIDVAAPILSQDAEDPQAASILARAYDGAGEADLAIGTYARRLTLVPDDKKSAIRLAELLLAKGDAKHACAVAKATLKTHKDDPAVLTLLSRAMLARGMVPAALKTAKQAAEQQPESASAWLQIARAHTAMGDQRLAIEGYRRCLGVDPQHSAALLGLGGLLVEQREYRGATEVLNRAVKVSPDDPRGHNALAAVHNRLGRHDKATAAMRAAYKLRPRHPLLLRNLIEVLLDAGRAREAAGFADEMTTLLGAKGVSETARVGLRRSLVRTVVIATLAKNVCAGSRDADAVSEQSIAQLRQRGLAATRAEVTRFAAEASGQAKAAIKRCSRPPLKGVSKP
jgi:tetratricopeptide (TPR) repeat protein